jgi:hypothetical protein
MENIERKGGDVMLRRGKVDITNLVPTGHLNIGGVGSIICGCSGVSPHRRDVRWLFATRFACILDAQRKPEAVYVSHPRAFLKPSIYQVVPASNKAHSDRLIPSISPSHNCKLL